MHCSLLLTPRGLGVVDLSGKTSVNGRRIRCVALDDGDEMQMGPFRLRVHYETPLQPGRPTGVSESFVLALVDRFAAMQQQMFDQNHQQMMMLMQMFHAMHQSQQDLIHDDLMRLHEITREMQQLQNELLRQRAESAADGPESSKPEAHFGPGRLIAPFSQSASDPGPSAAERAGSPEPATGEERSGTGAVSEVPGAQAATEETAPQTSADPPQAGGPDAESERPSSVKPAQEDGNPDAATEGGEAAPTAGSAADDEPGMAAPPEEGDGPRADESPDDETMPPEPEAERTVGGDGDDHLWLAGRLRELERERRSRWRKIMQVLTGGRG